MIAALLSLGMWKFMLGIEEPDDMAMIIFVVCAGMFCVLGIYYIIRGINEKIRHRKMSLRQMIRKKLLKRQRIPKQKQRTRHPRKQTLLRNRQQTIRFFSLRISP